MLTSMSPKQTINNSCYQEYDEVTFQCPSCCAMETLLFEEGNMLNTRRWAQVEGQIFHHNCGRPAHPFASKKTWVL